MSTFHDDFRAMCAEMDARRGAVALRRRAMVIEPVTKPATAKAYSYRSTCSLCDSPSDDQVCPRCSNHFAKGGTL